MLFSSMSTMTIFGSSTGLTSRMRRPEKKVSMRSMASMRRSPDTCSTATMVRHRPSAQRAPYLVRLLVHRVGSRRTRSPSSTKLRRVAGDQGFVDLVDLLFVHVLEGELQVDLAADEDVEQVGIDMAVLREVAEDAQRLRQHLALLVRAVLGGQRLEDVGDRHQPRLDRHLVL